MLRAARALAPLGIALLGVNLGRLGFLTAVTNETFDAALADVVSGRYTTDERALLDAGLARGGRDAARALALNDVVVARGAMVRSIHLAVRVDGEGARITVRRSETVAKLVRTAHAKPFVELLRQKILKEPGT